jgi:hypothetical protein
MKCVAPGPAERRDLGATAARRPRAEHGGPNGDGRRGGSFRIKLLKFGGLCGGAASFWVAAAAGRR